MSVDPRTSSNWRALVTTKGSSTTFEARPRRVFPIKSPSMTFVKALLLMITIVLTQVSSEKAYHWSEDVTGFSRERVLPDGERERRVHYGKLTAVETSVDLDQGNALILRQLSDGASFLQLILNRDQELVDCEFLKDYRTVSRFFRNLAGDFACAEHRSQRRLNDTTSCERGSTLTTSSNDSFRLVTSVRELDEDWKELLNLRLLRRKCKKLHRQIKLILHEQQRSDASSRQRDESDNLEDGEDLDWTSGQHSKQPSFNSSPSLLRRKRDLFLYPGTNWCGTGNSARKFTELGINARADRCCRDHDHCPFTIEAFKRKFHLFNYRFHTVSHCECDERWALQALAKSSVFSFSSDGVSEILEGAGREVCPKETNQLRRSLLFVILILAREALRKSTVVPLTLTVGTYGQVSAGVRNYRADGDAA